MNKKYYLLYGLSLISLLSYLVYVGFWLFMVSIVILFLFSAFVFLIIKLVSIARKQKWKISFLKLTCILIILLSLDFGKTYLFLEYKYNKYEIDKLVYLGVWGASFDIPWLSYNPDMFVGITPFLPITFSEQIVK